MEDITPNEIKYSSFGESIELETDWNTVTGVSAPEDNADVTSENPQDASWVTGLGALATKDQVDTAEVVDGAVSKVKMELASVDADILAANAVTSVKIDDNAITAPKILANAVTAGKIAANAVTATEINVSTLSAISANIGTVTAGNINGLTITGGTVRTSSSGKRVQMSSSDYLQIYDASRERMRLSDQYLYFYNSLGNNVGKLYTSSNTNMYLEAPNGNYVVLNAAGRSYSIIMQNAGNTVANFNTNGLTIASGRKISTPETSSTYLTSVNTLRFTATNSPLTDNGSIYFSLAANHFYGRISGVWKQLDN